MARSQRNAYSSSSLTIITILAHFRQTGALHCLHGILSSRFFFCFHSSAADLSSKESDILVVENGFFFHPFFEADKRTGGSERE